MLNMAHALVQQELMDQILLRTNYSVLFQSHPTGTSVILFLQQQPVITTTIHENPFAALKDAYIQLQQREGFFVCN